MTDETKPYSEEGLRILELGVIPRGGPFWIREPAECLGVVRRLLATIRHRTQKDRTWREAAEAQVAALKAAEVRWAERIEAAEVRAEKAEARADELQRVLDAEDGVRVLAVHNETADIEVWNDGHAHLYTPTSEYKGMLDRAEKAEQALRDFERQCPHCGRHWLPDREGPPALITGSAFLDAVHKAIPDAFSDMDGVIGANTDEEPKR